MQAGNKGTIDGSDDDEDDMDPLPTVSKPAPKKQPTPKAAKRVLPDEAREAAKQPPKKLSKKQQAAAQEAASAAAVEGPAAPAQPARSLGARVRKAAASKAVL
jgi:hypothetical protein